MRNRSAESGKGGQIWRTAIHEAGHAVACVVLKRRVRYVAIKRNADGCVRCSQNPRLDARRRRNRLRTIRHIFREVTIAWAGVAAEHVICGVRSLRGLHYDGMTIDRLLDRLGFNAAEKIDAGATLFRDAVNLVKVHRVETVRIAHLLVSQRRLGGNTCRVIVGDNSIEGERDASNRIRSR